MGKSKTEEGDSWDSLEGVMSHVKKSSVELQHEAWKSIAEKHLKEIRKP